MCSPWGIKGSPWGIKGSCAAPGARCPVDLVDRILYVHADIDTRLRLRAPPRRIATRVLAAVDGLVAACKERKTCSCAFTPSVKI
jgi:hypothetical protein